MAKKLTGEVLWFNDVKGYGSIRDLEGRQYFAHYKAIQQSTTKSGKAHLTLKPGQQVSFIRGSQPIEGLMSFFDFIAEEIK